jgi:hypothetical protein
MVATLASNVSEKQEKTVAYLIENQRLFLFGYGSRCSKSPHPQPPRQKPSWEEVINMGIRQGKYAPPPPKKKTMWQNQREGGEGQDLRVKKYRGPPELVQHFRL